MCGGSLLWPRTQWPCTEADGCTKLDVQNRNQASGSAFLATCEFQLLKVFEWSEPAAGLLSPTRSSHDIKVWSGFVISWSLRAWIALWKIFQEDKGQKTWSPVEWLELTAKTMVNRAKIIEKSNWLMNFIKISCFKCGELASSEKSQIVFLKPFWKLQTKDWFQVYLATTGKLD